MNLGCGSNNNGAHPYACVQPLSVWPVVVACAMSPICRVCAALPSHCNVCRVRRMRVCCAVGVCPFQPEVAQGMKKRRLCIGQEEAESSGGDAGIARGGQRGGVPSQSALVLARCALPPHFLVLSIASLRSCLPMRVAFARPPDRLISTTRTPHACGAAAQAAWR